ncbi:MAG: hypothetical protein ACRBB6_03100 [Neptuniibacter sp.]
MTTEEFNAWLTTPSVVRVLLLELEHSTGTEYVSNYGYIGEPVTRDNQHRQYEPVLAEAIEISDRLDGEFSVGDLTLVNDGLLDTWRTLKWQGYSVKGYLGASDWSREDFQQVLLSTNAGIVRAEDGEIVFGIQDARAQLDAPLITETVNGAGAPVVFGQVFNISPVLEDAATLLYKVSAFSLTSLDAADRGNPAFAETIDLANGEFTATASPVGAVTANATGESTTAAGIASEIAALYGLSTDSDSLNTLPTWTIGLFYSDGTSTTGADVLDDICASIGGYWRIDNLNRLQVFVLSLPALGSLTLLADDIERGTLELTSVQPPLSQISVRYSRNFTPMQPADLASEITLGTTIYQSLQEEWKAETLNPTLTGYAVAPKKQFDTALVNQVDALMRAQNIEAIRVKERNVWEFTAFAPGLQIQAGDTVFLQHDNWPEFSAGRWVKVLVNVRNLTGENCELEVWF